MSELNSENAPTPDSPTEKQPLPNADALGSILSAIKPSENPNTSHSGAADILSGLMSNPEILAKLPAMIETVKPLLQNLSPPPKEAVKEEQPHKNNEHDRRAALLLALKPYLSKQRCDAIDYIVKISGITEMFR